MSYEICQYCRSEVNASNTMFHQRMQCVSSNDTSVLKRVRTTSSSTASVALSGDDNLWNKLPDDLGKCILGYLDLQSLFRCMSVSQRLHALAHAYCGLCKDFITPDNLAELIHDVPIDDVPVDYVLAILPALHRLDVKDSTQATEISDKFLGSIAKHYHRLHHLALIGYLQEHYQPISSTFLQAIVTCNQDHLKELSIAYPVLDEHDCMGLFFYLTTVSQLRVLIYMASQSVGDYFDTQIEYYEDNRNKRIYYDGLLGMLQSCVAQRMSLNCLEVLKIAAPPRCLKNIEIVCPQLKVLRLTSTDREAYENDYINTIDFPYNCLCYPSSIRCLVLDPDYAVMPPAQVVSLLQAHTHLRYLFVEVCIDDFTGWNWNSNNPRIESSLQELECLLVIQQEIYDNIKSYCNTLQQFIEQFFARIHFVKLHALTLYVQLYPHDIAHVRAYEATYKRYIMEQCDVLQEDNFYLKAMVASEYVTINRHRIIPSLDTLCDKAEVDRISIEEW